MLCLSQWLAPAAQAQSTETAATLADLTRETLALRHNLLSAEESFFHLNPNTLTIYINTDNLPDGMLHDISITLDGNTIVQHSFNNDELQALDKGAMKKVYAAAITPGPHELKTVINGSVDEGQNSNTQTLEKGPGHDILKVTVLSVLHKRRPELLFEQQRGVGQ